MIRLIRTYAAHGRALLLFFPRWLVYRHFTLRHYQLFIFLALIK